MKLIDSPKKVHYLNKKQLLPLLKESYTFISQLEVYCNFPERVDEFGGNTEWENNKKNTANKASTGNEGEKNGPVLDVKKRLRGLEEIESKLEEIKGKRLGNIKEHRYKKNLKTRLAKQKKEKAFKREKTSKRQKKLFEKKMERAANESQLGGKQGEVAKIKRAAHENGGGKQEEVVKIKKAAYENRIGGKQEEVANGVNKNNKSGKPFFNKDDSMMFNKIDFSGLGNTNKKNKFEKKPQQLLEKLKRTETKINELQKSGEHVKAKQIKEKNLWMSALKRAEGIKVKDDVDLLKKTVRKEKQMKNQRKAKWEARVQAVEKQKEDRQKKRQENISAKKKEKKKMKMKKAVKKGRIILPK